MRNIAIATLLAFICQGCGAALLAALLSGGDVDDLTENFEETIETHQLLAEFAMAAARGDVDTDGYTYDPPSAENGMTGTLSLNNATLPFGDGLIEVVLKVDGDGAPVDPFATDMSSMGELDGNIQITFRGVSPNGKPLDIDADVDVLTLQNNLDTVKAVMSGTWGIDLDGYGTSLKSDGMELDVDLLTDEVTNAIGKIDGSIDIPNFPIDGEFDVEGLGEQLEVGIDVAVTEIEFLVDLIDIF
jgi:hypothetical protein